MKKILVIHNKYRQLGGEDIAVNNELLMLKKNYEVKELYFENNKSHYLQLFLSFVLNKNLKSMSILKKTISEFNPDFAFISTDGITAKEGLTYRKESESNIVKHMLNKAKKKVVLFTEDKVGIVENITSTKLDNIDTFITSTMGISYKVGAK